jgi:hypothetical protein
MNINSMRSLIVSERITELRLHKNLTFLSSTTNIIQKGDEAIQEEMKQEREDWLAARKADREFVEA